MPAASSPATAPSAPSPAASLPAISAAQGLPTIVVNVPPASKPDPLSWYETPLGAGLLALLGVLIGLWLAHRRMTAEFAHSDRQAAASHQASADEAQVDRFYHSKIELYGELLSSIGDLQGKMGLLAHSDEFELATTMDPYARFSLNMGKITLLANIETIKLARGYQDDISMLYMDMLSKLPAIHTRKRQLQNARALWDDTRAAISANNVGPTGRAQLEVQLATVYRKIQDLEPEVTERVLALNEMVTSKIADLVGPLHDLQLRLREELGVGGDWSLLTEQALAQAQMAKDALERVKEAARADI